MAIRIFDADKHARAPKSAVVDRRFEGAHYPHGSAQRVCPKPASAAQNDFKFLVGGGDAMMNRRQILCAAAAGAAIFPRIPNVQAATYDVVIKGGRVIDPSVGLDGVRDVAITGGRIVAIEPNIMGDASDTIDAR